MEKMTKELLQTSYDKELNNENILWLTEDYQKNETLAKQFNVAASCVVVAKVNNGVITEYQRLDDVWTLMEDTQAFNRYIADTIDLYLQKIKDKS